MDKILIDLVESDNENQDDTDWIDHIVDQLNSIGCTSFILSPEEVEQYIRETGE